MPRAREMAPTLPEQIVRLSSKMSRSDAHVITSLWCEHTDEEDYEGVRFKLECDVCVKEMVDYYADNTCAIKVIDS